MWCVSNYFPAPISVSSGNSWANILLQVSGIKQTHMQYSSIKLLETICIRIFYLTEVGRVAHTVTQGFTKFCLHRKKKNITHLVKVKTMLQRKLKSSLITISIVYKRNRWREKRDFHYWAWKYKNPQEGWS